MQNKKRNIVNDSNDWSNTSNGSRISNQRSRTTAVKVENSGGNNIRNQQRYTVGSNNDGKQQKQRGQRRESKPNPTRHSSHGSDREKNCRSNFRHQLTATAPSRCGRCRFLCIPNLACGAQSTEHETLPRQRVQRVGTATRCDCVGSETVWLGDGGKRLDLYSRVGRSPKTLGSTGRKKVRRSNATVVQREAAISCRKAFCFGRPSSLSLSEARSHATGGRSIFQQQTYDRGGGGGGGVTCSP